MLKTENSLLKHPSVVFSSKLSSSVQSLTNSTVPEPLLVEVKPIQGWQKFSVMFLYTIFIYTVVHVDYSGGVKVAVTVQVGSSGIKAQVIIMIHYNIEYNNVILYCRIMCCWALFVLVLTAIGQLWITRFMLFSRYIVMFCLKGVP